MTGTQMKSAPLKTASLNTATMQPVRPVPDATRSAIVEQTENGGDKYLWRAHTLAMAADGTVKGDFAANHLAFAPNDVKPGSLYVARGEVDAMKALGKGAAGCISAHPLRGPHVLVADVEDALARIARASRNRARATMTGIAGFDDNGAVTEVLNDALGRASRGMSWRAKNGLGMAAALCTLQADRTHALFTLEQGAEARMLRPHLLICGPTIDPAEGRAIAATLQAGGAAVLPADSCDFGAWRAAALDAGAQVYGYGRKASADIRLIDTVRLDNGETLVTAEMMGRAMCWSLAPGIVDAGCDALSSLAVMGAMRAAGASLGAAALALAALPHEEEPAQLAIAV